MSFKKNQPVRFRTRSDRPQMTGKFKERIPGVKGDYLLIKADDGRELKVRPANVHAT